MSSVTSLNLRQGVVNLSSSDSSIGITQSGVNDINLIASKQGSLGGVLSLNTITGATTLQSSGQSLVFTYPNGQYPSGHVINIEAVQGGVVGINTINSIQSDGTHNFAITGSNGISIDAITNGINIQGANSVTEMNGLFPSAGTIDIAVGSGLSVSNSGNTITLAYTGSVASAVETVNGLAPLNNDIEIAVGAGLSVVNSGHTVTLAYTGSVANAVETVNGLAPLNNDIEIAVGAGLSVVNSGNTITLANTNTSTGGFELTHQGTLVFTGIGCSNSTAPYSVYVSGASPNQIATIQIGVSGYSTGASTPASFTATPVLPAGFLPKYLQRGTAWGQIQSGNVFSFPYSIDTDGLLSLLFDEPSQNIFGLSVFSLFGISFTFPIAVPLDFSFSLGFAGYALQESVLPTTEPDPSIALTLANSLTPITALNLSTGAGSSTAILSNIAFSQSYTAIFNVNNSIITRYVYGTATIYDTVSVASVAGSPTVEILGIACPADSDDLFAFCFDPNTGLHTLYNVYNILTNNSILIAIPAQAGPSDLRALSCSTTQIVCCYAHGAYNAIQSTNGFDNLEAGMFLVSSVVDPEMTTAMLDPSNNYYVSHATDAFFTSRNFTTNAIIQQFTLPNSSLLAHFMGTDPYGNLLASIFVSQPPPLVYQLFAYNKVNQIIEYYIGGTWDTNAIPVCMGQMIEG